MLQKWKAKEMTGKTERNLTSVQQGQIDIHIGKNGLTTRIIEEIKIRLEKHKIIKIKILPKMTREEVKQIAEQVATRTNSLIRETRGRTIILERTKR